MSTAVVMPAVSANAGDPPLPGRILKTYRMPHHSVDVGEPLADVLVGRNIVTVCANRDGFLYRMNAIVGNQVKAGQVIATVGGLYPQYTHEIFIAYRRADSLGHAGRVGELLMRDFGRWQVFKDIESLPPGQDFVEYVRAALGRALVVVVVVGPRWLTLSGQDGQRRLDDPTDLHREEIRTALARGLPVFPVLVEGASGPQPHPGFIEVSRPAALG
jgi:hypothetical protein